MVFAYYSFSLLFLSQFFFFKLVFRSKEHFFSLCHEQINILIPHISLVFKKYRLREFTFQVKLVFKTIWALIHKLGHWLEQTFLLICHLELGVDGAHENRLMGQEQNLR